MRCVYNLCTTEREDNNVVNCTVWLSWLYVDLIDPGSTLTQSTGWLRKARDMLSAWVFCTALPTRYVQLSVCLSHWLQYRCQGVQHKLHKIVLNLSLNLISLYDERHISCVCPCDVILNDIYGLFSGEWQSMDI